MDFKIEPQNVKILGRYLYNEGGCQLDFSGSSIEFTSTCKRVEVKMHSNESSWDVNFQSAVAVFIDDMTNPAHRFLLDKDDAFYSIYESDEERTVQIRLVRLSEACFGKMQIDLIRTDNEKPLIPAPMRERRIEFIGDSITCGYGIEGVFPTDSFTTSQENCLKNYACLTANALNADYHLISWSGIGTTSGSIAPEEDEPSVSWLMPMAYRYTSPAYENDQQKPREQWEKWDSRRFPPDIIVINLGTNDAFYTKGRPERIEQYICDYVDFLKEIREMNPASYLLSTLGVMNPALCPAVEEAVRRYRDTFHDEKISYMQFDLQDQADGLGTDSHPNEITHRKMAQKLTAEIKKLSVFSDSCSES